MKKDIAVRAIRTLRFIWREAKRPTLTQNVSLKMNLSPGKDTSYPMLTLDIVSKVRLVYILLGILLTIHLICKAVSSLFK